LEAEISDNGSSSYCWWWYYNNGYEGTSPPLLAANEFVRTPFVDSLPRTVNIYVCVRKVVCRSILIQVVLSVVPFIENNLLKKKNYYSVPKSAEICYKKM
jgi:hypothetical protein